MTSYYLSDVSDFKRVDEVVKRLIRNFKPYVGLFDTLVVSGVSGLIIGPILAYKLKVNLVVVRKEGEFNTSHAEDIVEGKVGNKLVFLDDFISTGKTLEYVIERIADAIKEKDEFCMAFHNKEFTSKFVGFALYSNARSKNEQYERVYSTLWSKETLFEIVHKDSFVIEIESEHR